MRRTHRLKTPRPGWLVAALCAALGAAGLYATRTAEAAAGVGAHMPDAEILMGKEGKVSAIRPLLNRKWTFLVCTSYPIASLIEPAEAVLAHFSDVQFLFVVKDDEDNRRYLSTLPAHDRLTFGRDPKGALQRRLSQAGATEYAASFFIDPDGVIQYMAPVIRPEEMRLLGERHMAALEIKRDPQPPGYTLGSTVPPGAVTRVSDGRKQTVAELAQSGATIIFFRANCTTCGTRKLVAGLAPLKEAGVFAGTPKVYAVFSHGFDATELKQSVASAERSAPEIYAGDAYFPEWEDPYYVGMLERNEIMVVTYSQKGVLTHVEPYFEWQKTRVREH